MKLEREVIEMIDVLLQDGYEIDMTIFDTQVAIHIKPGGQEAQEVIAEPEEIKKTKTEKRDQVVVMFTKQGMTVKAIAKEVGLSEQTVRNYLKAAGY